MTLSFQRATKKQARLRLALEGPAGYGKTYTALSIARALTEEGQRVAFIDTEARSASKYADLFDFDVIELDPPFHPRRFVEAIAAAEGAGYGAIVIDSLSHAWAGDGGTLDIVDQLAKDKYRGDSHRAWREGGEFQQALIDAILRSKLHVIASMRTKTDYVREEVERDGKMKTVIRKAGTKTVQRDEFDYEFDIIGRFDTPTVLTIVKSRCSTLPPEEVVRKPGSEFALRLKSWLADGAEVPPPMSEETRKRIDSKRAAAHANPQQKERYLAGVAVVQTQGFTSWTGFLERATEDQAAVVEAALTPEPEIPAESSEVKQPQLVA